MARTEHLTNTCSECLKVVTVQVDSADLARYRGGEAHIQDAFPYLTADEREIFISGICGKCFDKLFTEDEDDETDDDA